MKNKQHKKQNSVHFKTTETNEEPWDTEIDINREIIASVARNKYCDNFNITIEDKITPQDLVIEGNKGYLQTWSLNPEKTINLDESLFSKASNKNISIASLSRLVTTLAKDMGISEEKAYQTIITRNGSLKPKIKSRLSSIYSPTNENLNTIASYMKNQNKKRKSKKRRHSKTNKKSSRTASAKSRKSATTSARSKNRASYQTIPVSCQIPQTPLTCYNNTLPTANLNNINHQ